MPIGVDLKDVWEKARTQEYAFDDFSRDRLEWFLFNLADTSGMTKYFLIDNSGLFICHGNMVEGGDCTIHFVVWDRNLSMFVDKEPGYELLDYLFYEVKLHRVSGPIPKYNRLGPKFALAMGMKFEGEMTEAVLWRGTYHNVAMYGLLAKWYETRLENIFK